MIHLKKGATDGGREASVSFPSLIPVRLEEEKLFTFLLQFLLNGLLAFLIKKEVVQLAASKFSSLKKEKEILGDDQPC